MRGQRFEVEVRGGRLVGCIRGDGPRVLLLHGGPGMSGDWLDLLADELVDGYEVAWFQQRGVAPSSVDGPFDLDTAVADVVAVLDTLGWDRAVVGGFSYGGHLVLHLLAEHPDRLVAALSIDPLGGVGDGGEAAFGAAFEQRLPAETRAELAPYNEREAAGEILDERDGLAQFELFWPAYFGDPSNVMPYDDTIRLSPTASSQLYADVLARLPGLADRIAGSGVATLFVHGGASPMPVSASTDTAAAIGDAAQVVVVEGSGHFVWYENPGAVRHALDTFLAARA
jgi:pimeloyl-ACP methyl ester carboxylesterase